MRKNLILISFSAFILNVAISQIHLSGAKVIELSAEDFEHKISSYELVFVNFHAEWCRFSNQLQPIFEASNDIILKEYPEPNKVLFANVDCDNQPPLSRRYQISKYPTLKVFLNGKPIKKEYRGERTQKAITDYVRELLADPVKHIVFDDLINFTALVFESAAVIGYYKVPPIHHPKYDMFRRVAADLKGYCKFYWVTNSPFLQDKDELIAFKSAKKGRQSESQSVFKNYEELSAWSVGLCIPVVREITFNNAEEIIEEGLPLVILFHNADDQESVDWFTLVVHYELIKETSNVNFVTAEANLFGHPLKHLGKTKKDLPLIAIDSFKHIKGRILAAFIEDLKSGKLHREFHFGPDKEAGHEAHQAQTDRLVDKSQEESPQEEKLSHEEEINGNDIFTPVADSVFKKLAPSSNRYTLLKDEL